ncbi:MAG TPA: hypothetical protein VIY73_08660 [Polyangiaceae bacterium]
MWAAVPSTAAAQTAPGDVAQARDLFVQASELRDQGDVRGALEKFEAAHALAPNPITTFELARTYEALGMLERARDTYRAIARLPVRAEETERATNARRDGAKAAEDLGARIPSPAPAVPEAAPPTSQVVSRPEAGAGGMEATAAPCKAAGAPQLAVASLVDASGQVPEGGGNRFGPVAYAGFGVGAIGFVVGTVLAGATMSKASSISCSSVSCEQSSEDAAHAARTLGIAATVSYVLGGVGVAVGVVDLLVYKPAPAAHAADVSLHAWVGAGAGGLRGSF